MTDGPATVVDAGGQFVHHAGRGWLHRTGRDGDQRTNFTDPEDSCNTVWRFSVSGGTANAYLGTVNLSSDPVLDSGFDLSGDGLGQLVFDIKVISLSPGTTLTVKIDSGYPDLGQVALTASQYTVGSWRRVAINFADLLANPDPGAGLDLNNVVNAFVIEVTGGDAEFYLDNIFISHACPEVDGCNATVKTKPAYSLVWSDEFDGTTATANWLMKPVTATMAGAMTSGSCIPPARQCLRGGGNLAISAQCASRPRVANATERSPPPGSIRSTNLPSNTARSRRA